MSKLLKQLLLFTVVLPFLFLVKNVNAESLPSDGYNVSKDRWIMLDDSSKYITTYLDKNSIKLSSDKSKVFFDLKCMGKTGKYYKVFKQIFHIDKGYEEYLGAYNVDGDKVEYKDLTKPDPNSLIATKLRVIANNGTDHKAVIVMQPYLDGGTYKKIIDSLIPEYDPVPENSDNKFEESHWIMINNYFGINKRSIKKGNRNPKWVDFSIKEQISPNEYVVGNLTADPERNIIAVLQTYRVKYGKVVTYTDNRIIDSIPLTEYKTLEWELDTDPLMNVLCFIKAYRGVKK